MTNSNSFLRFLLRATIQFFRLTLQRTPTIAAQTKQPPYFGILLGANAWCLLLHLIESRPSAGEAARGYLHGHGIIDFIGQLGPISKFHLVVLDLAITVLQLVMLVALTERQKQIGEIKGTNVTGIGNIPGRLGAGGTQDYDSEERGVLLGESSAAETEALLASSERQASREPMSETERLDYLFSGQATVAELSIADTVREQYRSYVGGAAPSNPSDRPVDRLRTLSAVMARVRAGAG